MAFTNNGTIVSVPAGQVPSGFTAAAVAEVASTQPGYVNQIITVLKAGVEDADKVVTFTALVAAITAAVSIIAQADLDDIGNTIVVSADFKSYRSNMIFAEDLLTDTVQSYKCVVDITVNIA